MVNGRLVAALALLGACNVKPVTFIAAVDNAGAAQDVVEPDGVADGVIDGAIDAAPGTVGAPALSCRQLRNSCEVRRTTTGQVFLTR